MILWVMMIYVAIYTTTMMIICVAIVVVVVQVLSIGDPEGRQR